MILVEFELFCTEFGKADIWIESKEAMALHLPYLGLKIVNILLLEPVPR